MQCDSGQELQTILAEKYQNNGSKKTQPQTTCQDKCIKQKYEPSLFKYCATATEDNIILLPPEPISTRGEEAEKNNRLSRMFGFERLLYVSFSTNCRNNSHMTRFYNRIRKGQASKVKQVNQQVNQDEKKKKDEKKQEKKGGGIGSSWILVCGRCFVSLVWKETIDVFFATRDVKKTKSSETSVNVSKISKISKEKGIVSWCRRSVYAWMGNFFSLKNNPFKLANRLALSCLSHSIPVIQLSPSDRKFDCMVDNKISVYTVPDVFSQNRGNFDNNNSSSSDCSIKKNEKSIMTDGCGLISSDLALKISKNLPMKSMSVQYATVKNNKNSNEYEATKKLNIVENSAFQVRCVCRWGGFKGMLVMHPGLPKNTVIFRNSMRKFGPPAEILNKKKKIKLKTTFGGTLDICGQNNPPLPSHTLGGSLSNRINISEIINSAAVFPIKHKQRLINLFRAYTCAQTEDTESCVSCENKMNENLLSLMHIAQPMNRQVALVLIICQVVIFNYFLTIFNDFCTIKSISKSIFQLGA